ncbi:MAG: hypothetical protein MI892_00055 [Desulfobacterales bacterium]|nr:hypothetical protein [Desulfobacterales bacterium]
MRTRQCEEKYGSRFIQMVMNRFFIFKHSARNKTAYTFHVEQFHKETTGIGYIQAHKSGNRNSK